MRINFNRVQSPIRIIAFLMLNLISMFAFAEKDSISRCDQYVIPTEDYLTSNSGLAMTNSTSPDSKNYKTATFVYYNDSIAIFYLGISGKIDIVRIVKKSWSDYYKSVFLQCRNFNSNKINDWNYDVVITIPYQGIGGRDYNNSKPDRPLNEYSHDAIKVDFPMHFVSYTMYDCKSQIEKIPALQKKFPKYFKVLNKN